MKTIDDIKDFMKTLNPNPGILEQLYYANLECKSIINERFGLTEENEYRRIIDVSISDEEFKLKYPYTYGEIFTLLEGNKFSIVKNEVYYENVTGKLSKIIPNCLDTENPKYALVMSELGRNDLNIIFDIVKPKKLVISTNMYDIMTSSSNSSFTSCYSISGSHFNGNISYLRDNFTVIAYTFSDDIKKKIGRVFLYVFTETEKFILSRIYGSMYSNEIKILVEDIQNLLNPKTAWKMCAYNHPVTHYKNARPYYDLPNSVYFDSMYTRLIYHGRKSIPRLNFSYSKCLYCGNETKHGKYGACRECDQHFTHCVHCNTSINRYNSRIVLSDGRKLYVCIDCKEKEYELCEKCNHNSHRTEMKMTPDKDRWCSTCLHKFYKKCPICNTYHKGTQSINGLHLCKKCKKNRVIKCSECRSDMISGMNTIYELDGNKMCKKCYLNRLVDSAIFFGGEWHKTAEDEAGVSSNDNSLNMKQPVKTTIDWTTIPHIDSSFITTSTWGSNPF